MMHKVAPRDFNNTAILSVLFNNATAQSIQKVRDEKNSGLYEKAAVKNLFLNYFLYKICLKFY